jgi:hypothetical protein
MPIITLKETITKTIDIPMNTLCQVIDNLSEDERNTLMERLKNKSLKLKSFKKDNIRKIMSDFQKTKLYEDGFLKDLEAGLMKSSINREV